MANNVEIEKLTAEEIMNKTHFTIKEGATVSEALAKMKKHDVHELPVIKDKKMVGLLSYARMTKHRKMMMTSQVEHFMVKPPKVVANDKLPKIIEALLTHDFRSLPVTSNRQVIGMISRTNIIKIIKQYKILMAQDVQTVMTRDPVFIKESENVSKAIHHMMALEESSIPVVDKKGKVSGYVTIKDLTDHLKAPRRKASKYDKKGEKVNINVRVDSVKNVPPVTVTEDGTVGDAIKVMKHKGVPCCVVDSANKPVGLITELDLIDLVRRHLERDDTIVEITGLEQHDPYTYNEMYELINRHLKRINKVQRCQMLSVHVIHHHHERDLSKYTLHGRLSLPKHTFSTQMYDWDLMSALDHLMENFETQVRKYHGKKMDSRKKGRRR